MRILLLRHGEAMYGYGVRDEHRHLTRRGRAQATAVGRHLRAQGGFEGTEVWTSPLVRAVQTTELALRGWRCPAVVEAKPWLAFGRVGELLDGLLEAEAHSVMLVGHLPLHGEAARVLAGSQAVANPSPGTLIVLDGEPEPGGCQVIDRFDASDG